MWRSRSRGPGPGRRGAAPPTRVTRRPPPARAPKVRDRSRAAGAAPGPRSAPTSTRSRPGTPGDCPPRWRSQRIVRLLTASLSLPPATPASARRRSESSERTNCTWPRPPPRSTHCRTYRNLNAGNGRPRLPARITSATWAPIGNDVAHAARRCPYPGAATWTASPAPKMSRRPRTRRFSSTTSLPARSTGSPESDASVGTNKPVASTTIESSSVPSSQEPNLTSAPPRRSASRCARRARRPGWEAVTTRTVLPAACSAPATSTPVNPAPTTVTGECGLRRSSSRSLSASASVATRWAPVVDDAPEPTAYTSVSKRWVPPEASWTASSSMRTAASRTILTAGFRTSDRSWPTPALEPLATVCSRILSTNLACGVTSVTGSPLPASRLTAMTPA